MRPRDSDADQQKRDGQKIAMTAPVTQRAGDGAWVIQFTMPGAYTLDSLPTPRNQRVKLREIDGGQVAVIRYSGRWTEENYLENLDALRAQIRSRDLVETGSPVWARYNAPITPWFLRRNEIMIPVAAPADG